MKTHIIIITTILISFSFSDRLLAQDSSTYKTNTSAYIKYFSKENGITVRIPQTFNDLHKYFVRRTVRIHKGALKLSTYGAIFQTKNKECIVMYPARPLPPMTKKEKQMAKVAMRLNRRLKGDTSTAKLKLPNPNKFPRQRITLELKDNTGLYDYFERPLSDTVHFHFNDHVTIIAGKKPQEMFNADTMYIYDLPLQKPLPKQYVISDLYWWMNAAATDSLHATRKKSGEEKYAYRTGLVLFKKGRGTMLFMLFFTPEGKKHEWKYINMLGKNVWYDEDFKQNEKG